MLSLLIQHIKKTNISLSTVFEYRIGTFSKFQKYCRELFFELFLPVPFCWPADVGLMVFLIVSITRFARFCFDLITTSWSVNSFCCFANRINTCRSYRQIDLTVTENCINIKN